MIPDVIRTAFSRTTTSVMKVSSIRTISAAMNESNIYKGKLHEVDKLLQIYLTFLVTSARTFIFFSPSNQYVFKSSMTECQHIYFFCLYTKTKLIL